MRRIAAIQTARCNHLQRRTTGVRPIGADGLPHRCEWHRASGCSSLRRAIEREHGTPFLARVQQESPPCSACAGGILAAMRCRTVAGVYLGIFLVLLLSLVMPRRRWHVAYGE
jgi:hypothetical protein